MNKISLIRRSIIKSLKDIHILKILSLNFNIYHIKRTGTN
ncbi:hypothetical protein HMPREF1342_03032 [Enterococcus faecalis ERV85]|nr:hypothetical protein HMPREF1334_02756 [Enterococcus faecalis ERV41]EJV26553.1 hypothetical protein HMPREF1340_02276 [Enterococcus faecalis ERV73]EJV26804.1 hypothetical protein HMPREF1339_01135 [Enterococcus faecalis ERV72]EJV31180.1 hypothetical protein HMPREF1342_03032 [Enterococcus faecalis ERV85]